MACLTKVCPAAQNVQERGEDWFVFVHQEENVKS